MSNAGGRVKWHSPPQLVGVAMGRTPTENNLCNRTLKLVQTREQFHFQKLYLRTEGHKRAKRKHMDGHGGPTSEWPHFPLLFNEEAA